MVTETSVLPTTPKSPAKEKALCLFETPRSFRLLFRKIGSQLDRQLFEIEAQKKRISLLEHENEEIRPKKRRKITYNGNAEFAKVGYIQSAREKMWKVLQPVKTSRKVQRVKLEDLCTEFHLNIH
ncbi:hypothetical protein FPOAC1_007311 [Fusarium poae]|uniref:hypothetical protein n=1 Tax=Fusarium poae TaxID=36050 RepID=UPI001CE7691C|nr:hypothetical protein FPOAC1_007311 [Fusarium poae]KAG8673992.1 hypothetical protein FPOAC1_007311 [Fusarium poae]